jgi:glycerophosphoryl diester phosphodiesterase
MKNLVLMLVKRKFIIRTTLVFLCLVFVWRYDFGLTKQIDFANVPIVFAHRGAVVNYPENSMPAFLAAIENGFVALEVDVVFTKDEKLLLFHDDNTLRLLGIDTPVNEVDFAFFNANQLLFNGEKSGHYAVSLDSFFAFLPPHVIVYLDVKTPGMRFADSIVWLIQKHKVASQVLVADAGFGFLSYIRLKDSDIYTVLEGFNQHKKYLLPLFPRFLKPDFVACFLNQTNSDFLNFLDKQSFLNRLIVYGINDENDGRLNKVMHRIVDLK